MKFKGYCGANNKPVQRGSENKELTLNPHDLKRTKTKGNLNAQLVRNKVDWREGRRAQEVQPADFCFYHSVV